MHHSSILPKLLAKEDITITNQQLQHITNYLNCDDFKKNYTYSGRFKIGHKLLCNSLLNIPSYVISVSNSKIITSNTTIR